MAELSQYSEMLEETSKGILESAKRNDELKTEFREFYETYQKGIEKYCYAVITVCILLHYLLRSYGLNRGFGF